MSIPVKWILKNVILRGVVYLAIVGLAIVGIKYYLEDADEPGIQGVPLSPEYAGMSGEALIQQLLVEETRSLAFYELLRRSGHADAADFESFLNDHYEPVVVVCPQGKGKPPIYVVLYGYFSRDIISISGGFQTNNPAELFTPTGNGDPVRSWNEPAIEVFTAKGKRVAPWGGDNLLSQPGKLADINGDGFVERASHTSYGVDGIQNVEVLLVSRVKPKYDPILTVLYNWGAAEWSYQLTDSDKDGIFDIELGPRIGTGGIKTKVVYKWDKAKKAYTGPQGSAGDHFRIIDGDDLCSEFDRLKAAKLTMPVDLTFVPEHIMRTDPSARHGIKQPPSKPYKYTSLRGLADTEIVSYMGDGRNMSELALASINMTHVPADFWTLAPKAAALATAEANRNPAHKARFRLAVDGRDGNSPPAICSLAFTDASDRSYFANDHHYFLRVDPQKSYLAYAGTAAGGMVFYDAVHDRPAFDFRYFKLEYNEARHIAHTVWWMSRVRSHEVVSSNSLSMTTSTDDGHGSLSMRNAEGGAILETSGTLWAGPVSERWSEGYDGETFLNLASYVIADALPEHMGKRWSAYDARHADGDAPLDEQEMINNIQALSAMFLALYTPEQTLISNALAKEAARAAGGLVFTELVGKLNDIQGKLPQPTKPLETMDPYNSADANDGRVLNSYITLALKQIRCADDLPALKAWACSKEPGAQWALQRLKTKDRQLYVAALEWWMKNTKENWARQAFDAIAKEDSARAVEIAKAIPPGTQGDLSVSAFAHLAAVDGIPDEAERVKALIKIALDPKSEWAERGKAIDQLVPPAQPLRYPTRDIDDALVALLDPKLGDPLINFTLGKACQGLARRGRTEYFDMIVGTLAKAKDPMTYGRMLAAVIRLAQTDPARYNPSLVNVLRPELKITNKMVTDLIMAAWSADLRELKPELECIATSGPDDYEDQRANSWGGAVRAVNECFHQARKIVALWNEEDPLVRCKLLLAFGLNDAFEFVDDVQPERLARMETELTRATQSLTPDQMGQVAGFLEWYRNEYISKEKEPIFQRRLIKFDALARRLLNLQ
ncbi:MAG: hypothetical protein ABIF71_08455 [Planctomycetota bacterium]